MDDHRPDKGAHGFTRRGALGAMGSASLLGRPANGIPAVSPRWEEALAVYRLARGRHEAFRSQVLDPACRLSSSDLQPYSGLGSIFELEEQAGDLMLERYRALSSLIAIPSDNWEALSLKLQLSYEEVFCFNDTEGMFAAILKDAKSLSDI